MRIERENIVIRKAEIKDAAVIYDWENDRNHWLVSNTVAPYSMQDILSFLSRNNDLFEQGQTRLMMEVKGQVAGCIDLFEFDQKNLRVGVGILIDAEFRGKGHGKTAIAALVDHCFETLDLHQVYAEVLSHNEASLHIFEACGFEVTGRKKAWMKNGDEYIDQLFLQRVKE